ncbi:MAG: tetratricopeptide repeat-containing sensor histidine kinase [Bacteroidota bacterium]
MQQDTAALPKVKTLVEIGKTLRHHYPDSALHYYKLAEDIARKNNLTEMEATAISAQGGTHYVKGEYDLSLEDFMQSLELYEKTGYKQGIANGLNNIGLIQNMLEDYDEAISYHERSIERSLKTQDTSSLFKNYLNLGVNYIGKKMPDSALHFLYRSLSMQKRYSKRELDTASCVNLIGEAHYIAGDYDSALMKYKSVIELGEQTTPWELSYAHTGAAKVYQEKKAHVKSTIHASKALEMAEQMNTKWDLQRITKILAENYAATEQWEKAYHYHTLHKKYSDSVFNEQKQNQINYLRLQRKEIENKNLERQNRLKELQLTKRNHQMWGIAGISIALIVLALSLYRNNALKTKLNRKLKQKNEAIARKNQELSDLNTTKDILFRVMAHDLKNPLSLVISYTEMLEEDFDDFEEAEIKDFIQKLNRASNDGLMLLENLMDWARSQTGAIEVKPEKINISEIVSEILALVSHNAESKNIQIQNNISDETPVWGDPNMTSAILRNLLTNAVKFTNPGGKVSLSAQKKENMMEITVEDDGMGMDDSTLQSLFDISLKKSREGTQKEKGTGLGLIICKDFTEKQGGSLKVSSAEDRGSRFRFTIPLAGH